MVAASSNTTFALDRVRESVHLDGMRSASEILEALKERGVKQDAMARVLNIAQPNITKLYRPAQNGKVRQLGFDEGQALIRAFQLEEWATGGPDAGPPAASASVEDIAAEHGFTFLEELDLTLGMGATYLDGQPEVLGLVPFKLDWLRNIHDGSFGHLKVVRGKGDSMEPAIFDGDIVVVDTGKTRIDDQDALWALAYGDLGMIRRVRQRPNGSWVLMAEKASVRDEIVGDGEVSVIGKVVWSARRY